MVDWEFLYKTKTENCTSNTAPQNALQATVQVVNFPELTAEDVKPENQKKFYHVRCRAS
jgi:hypothetical protein